MPDREVSSHDFGAALRAIREERGFSQEAFAVHAGIHRTYVGALERGEKNPTLVLVYRVAAALDLRGSQLLERAETIAAQS
jgi:transcriptional regulator with XRE-family HTH domain